MTSCTRDSLHNPSIVKLLVYYGVDVNGSANHDTPLHRLIELYPHNDPLLDPAIRMFVCSGLDRHKHYWLLDRLMSGVPFGRPELRQWLQERLREPPPLFHLCLVFFRTRFRQTLHTTLPTLPLPGLLVDALLLKDLFQEDVEV